MLDGIKKITFKDLMQSAVKFAKAQGGYGWIFKPEEGEEVVWYNPQHYTPTPILMDAQGSGRLDSYQYYEQLLGGVTC